MRIGIYIPAGPGVAIDALAARFRRAEEQGFHTAWFGQLFDHDALTLLALAAGVTDRIELGTWVIPTYPRHPSALAQQALTVQAASGNRLILGVGASHAAVIENRLGLDYRRPLSHMREYLRVLGGLMTGDPVAHEGPRYRVSLQIGHQGTTPPPVFLAALGPRMLELAGRVADGVAIWLGGPRYLAEFAMPRVRESARAAGRPVPRIACGLPIAVTPDLDSARRSAQSFLAQSSRLPAYRLVLEREGALTPADVAVIGDESEVRRQLEALDALGVTDFNAVLFPVESDPDVRARTTRFLSSLAGDGASGSSDVPAVEIEGN